MLSSSGCLHGCKHRHLSAAVFSTAGCFNRRVLWFLKLKLPSSCRVQPAVLLLFVGKYCCPCESHSVITQLHTERLHIRTARAVRGSLSAALAAPGPQPQVLKWKGAQCTAHSGSLAKPPWPPAGPPSAPASGSCGAVRCKQLSRVQPGRPRPQTPRGAACRGRGARAQHGWGRNVLPDQGVLTLKHG
jgi:hypothetical protein